MAVIGKQTTVKKFYACCDKCGKEEPCDITLHDGFEIQVVKKWVSVKGIKDGWLCPNCYDAIIQGWYAANKPSMMNMPLWDEQKKEYLYLYKPERKTEEVCDLELECIHHKLHTCSSPCSGFDTKLECYEGSSRTLSEEIDIAQRLIGEEDINEFPF